MKSMLKLSLLTRILQEKTVLKKISTMDWELWVQKSMNLEE